MAAISVRKLALLALLDAPDEPGKPGAPIVGVTRLQKLLFLMWKGLPHISPTRDIRLDLIFRPEKFGPADFDLYPDLDFLVTLGHVSRRPRPHPGRIERQPVSDRADVADATERELSYTYLIGDESEGGSLAIAEGTEDEYSITPTGRKLLARILSSVDGPGKAVCEKVVAAARATRLQYGPWPLQRLLRYVYTEYPDMTTGSEIRERVLGQY
ncbi:MAG: hypothetical protein ABSD62_03270 [Candidatus Limnocylindrales bacterium]|jgi:hypothetical protein